MRDHQDLIDGLRGIRASTLGLVDRLNSDDPQESDAAIKDYLALVDRFNQKSKHLAPHQHKAVKQDFEYFMRMIDLGIMYWETAPSNEDG